MRLPVEVLQGHLADMLAGLLLWSEDSKNKFRLKVKRLLTAVQPRVQSCSSKSAWAPGHVLHVLLSFLHSVHSCLPLTCWGGLSTSLTWRHAAASVCVAQAPLLCVLLWDTVAHMPPTGHQGLLSTCKPWQTPDMWRQVRVIVERLARRCGYEAVAGAMPPGDKRLLSHIRKEVLRKQRTRASQAGSQVRPHALAPAPCPHTWAPTQACSVSNTLADPNLVLASIESNGFIVHLDACTSAVTMLSGGKRAIRHKAPCMEAVKGCHGSAVRCMRVISSRVTQMGDDDDDDEDLDADVRSRTKGGRTERASAWNATKVFSDAGVTADGTKLGYNPGSRRPAAGGRRAAPTAAGRQTARPPRSLKRVRCSLPAQRL